MQPMKILNYKHMKFAGTIPYLFIAGFAWIVIISSCANQGMPSGGPRDTIPPMLTGTEPDYKALNYDGEEVRLTFNEYINYDKVSEKLVVSPPLEKRPSILTQSKTLIIRFNEELRDSSTYSLDFKNSIVDNNEQNPIKGLRFSFSTGNVYDSLRVAGKVIKGFDLEPVEDNLVLLHKNLHDSAVYTLTPDYIAKTNEKGHFLISNIASGKYHLFSVSDINNDLLYNEGVEKIAFADTLIVPSAEFHEEADTLVKGVDSLLTEGHTHYQPGPFYLRQFTEDIFEQYLKTNERESRYKCTFVFNEPVKDTFNIRTLNNETKDWYILEPNEKYDSLTMWISDTTVANIDTLPVELSYSQLDSMEQVYVEKDTVELTFSDKKEEPKPKRRNKKDDEEKKEPEPVPQFNWSTNIKSSAFDLNNDILLTSPQPVKHFDTSGILLYHTDDTLKTPLDFDFAKDTLAWRTFRIMHPWDQETDYTLEIDSAACTNIYGLTSHFLKKTFKTQEKNYYGTINLTMKKVNDQVLVQLLENTDKEKVVRQKTIEKEQTVVFDFIAPDKYKVKIIYDRNKNGKWDTGSYQDRYQPERVAYINEVIKVRSNWENNYNWDLEPDPTFTKNIRDKELEEKRKKEAEEKARQERNSGQQQQKQNNLLGPGGGSNPVGM
jgi:hypothetical protein